MPNGFKTLNLVKQRLADKTPVVFAMLPSVLAACRKMLWFDGAWQRWLPGQRKVCPGAS